MSGVGPILNVPLPFWKQAAQVEERQYLDLEGELDTDNMETQFEEEKGRRSLASIFESDEEDVLEVDAEMQDDSLKVRSLLRSFKEASIRWI